MMRGPVQIIETNAVTGVVTAKLMKDYTDDDFDKVEEDENALAILTMALTPEIAQGLINPDTEKTYIQVLWPPVDQEKVVPISRPLPDGSLRTMKYWVYDDASATVVIKLAKNQIRVNNAQDLLMFRENDIKTLSRFQIIVLQDIF